MISRISDAEQSIDDLFDLQNQRDRVEEQAQMEPYIPNLRDPYDDEMHVALEDPAPHQVFFYNQRIEDLAEDLGVDVDDNELIPDGGRPRKFFWTWITEDGNLLYESDLNGEEADVLYESPEEAREALERHFDRHPELEERYNKAGLYQIKLQDRVMGGVEVKTEQSGLSDFAPDGGYLMPEGYDQGLSELAESADELEW